MFILYVHLKSYYFCFKNDANIETYYFEYGLIEILLVNNLCIETLNTTNPNCVIKNEMNHTCKL